MRVSISLALLVVVCGCGPHLVPHGVPLYNVVAENATTRDFDDVKVTLGQNGAFPPDRTLFFGVMPPGIHKTISFVPVPIPDQVLVTWRVVGGSSGRQVVDVLDRAGAKFSGDLRFRILPDGKVELRLEPHKFHVEK